MYGFEYGTISTDMQYDCISVKWSFVSLAVLQRIQAEAEMAIRQGGAAPMHFRQEQLVGDGDTGQPAYRPVHACSCRQ